MYLITFGDGVVGEQSYVCGGRCWTWTSMTLCKRRMQWASIAHTRLLDGTTSSSGYEKSAVAHHGRTSAIYCTSSDLAHATLVNHSGSSTGEQQPFAGKHPFTVVELVRARSLDVQYVADKRRMRWAKCVQARSLNTCGVAHERLTA